MVSNVSDPYPPLLELVRLSPGDPAAGIPPDVWRLRDAYEGVQIFGATGAGKSSGSGQAIAKALLRAKCGFLICCAKPDERETWERYAAETGRSDHLYVISPTRPYPASQRGHFNFLNYELSRPGEGSGQTENLVNLFSLIIEIAEGGSAGESRDPFWERAARQMLRNAIEVLRLGGEPITIDTLNMLISEAPQQPPPSFPANVRDWLPGHHAYMQWRNTSYFAKVFDQATKRVEPLPDKSRDRHDFEVASRYWTHNFATLADRVRSSIVTTFSSVADILSHGLAWELLADDTTIVPEVAFDGGIIILDLPIQEWGEVGRVIQGIWKTMFQRAVLRRNVRHDPRPVCLWCDEAQNFISSLDFQFQAVARSARACTVYLTQNISNYHAKLGSNSAASALSLLGNFQTKIWHANGDYVTNQYAADTLGQHIALLSSHNVGATGGGKGEMSANVSGGVSQQLQHKILPADFARLRKGGEENGYMVDGVVFIGGRVFHATGDTYLFREFRQGEG